MNKGTHIIGDLYDCDLKEFAMKKSDLKHLKLKISQQIKKYHLTELGNYYHFFEKNAVTAVISLAESHLSFHTWPEDDYTTLDVFVCNHSRDNSVAARKLFDWFSKELLKAKRIKQKTLQR